MAAGYSFGTSDLPWGKPSCQIAARNNIITPQEKYKMDHGTRGVALIFSHEYFEHPSIIPKSGTFMDCINLKETLTEIGFAVEVLRNLRLSQIKEKISQVSKMDHSNADCILVAILSHGEIGYVFASDLKYRLETMRSYFTEAKCPTLANKPKLFIIQACQVGKFDSGLFSTNELEKADRSMNYNMPLYPDFLVAYSTFPDFDSPKFIEILCDEIREHRALFDILTLFGFVCQRVRVHIAFFHNSNDDKIFSNLLMVGLGKCFVKASSWDKGTMYMMCI